MKLNPLHLHYLSLSLLLISCSIERAETFQPPKDDGSNWERYGRPIKKIILAH